MKTHNVRQGSPDWLALRSQYFTASEAPAMLGLSKYQTRTELLHQKHTGLAAEVDAHTQGLFDRGHAAEAAARVLAENMLGEDLYPATGSAEALKLPAGFAAPAGSEVVPTPAAKQLAAYLLSLHADAPLYEAPYSQLAKP